MVRKINTVQDASVFPRRWGTTHRPRIIAVTGGVTVAGKSTLSLNLAVELGRLNKNVLLMSVDSGALADQTDGRSNSPNSNARRIQKGVNLEQLVVPGPGRIDLLHIPFSPGDSMIRETGDAWKRFDRKYDTIVVDAGLPLAMPFVVSADRVLVISTPAPASMTDAYAAIKLIRQSNASIPISMVVNMVRSDEEAETLFKKINLLCQKFLGTHLTFVGSLPRADEVVTSAREGRPFVTDFRDSSASRAIRMMAEILTESQSQLHGQRGSGVNSLVI